MAEYISLAEKYSFYAGKTVGDYVLERLVETFEIGPVFVARHTQAKTLHRLRLLELPPGLSPQDRLVYLGYFQQDAALLAALQHPLLLPLTDYGIYQGLPYLVSPDVPLRSLQDLLAQYGPLDALSAGRYLDQLAIALEYAYQQGILHLNLNARCIFLKADNNLALAETGLLRLLNPQTGLASYQFPAAQDAPFLLRDAQGKLLYGLSLASAPAPELLLGQPVDTFTDVYGLGALLYQMLTGHRVFRGETLSEIAQHHLKSGVPSLLRWRQDLPSPLDQLLARSLSKAAAERPHNGGLLANAYHQIVAPNEAGRKLLGIVIPSAADPLQIQASALPVVTSARTSSVPVRPIQRAEKRLSRRRVMTLATASGGVIVVIGAIAWLVAGKSTASSPLPAGPGGNSSSSGRGDGNGGTPATKSGTVLATVAQVPLNSAKQFPLQNSPQPGLVIHLQNNTFVAFNSTCTHAGCAVHYNAQDHLLECPCHGAVFDPSKNAAVVAGPAPSPLTPVPITVNSDGTITLKQ